MKRPVPGFVAVGIVDQLEVIHIEEHEAARLFLHAPGDLGLAGGPAHDPCDNIRLVRRGLDGKSLHHFLQQCGGRLNLPAVVLLSVAGEDGI